MSVVTEHLERRGSTFELLPHRQAYTSTDEARALGIDAGEVLKTLAVRTGPGYALLVIPASRRLDLHLVCDALGDNHAHLASEEELSRDFAGYQLGALPPLGTLLAASCTSIRRCWGTTPWCSRPAARPSRSGCGPRSCSAASRSRPCRWSSRRIGAATTRSVGGERRSRTWQAAGTQRRNAVPTGDTLTDPSGLPPEVASSKV
jgi:Aminoacyl-tRNA editing domain